MIEEVCKRINTLRLTGAKYTTMEIKEALKGLPYYGYIATAMRKYTNIAGYTVTTTGIIFNPKVSIYKDVIEQIITEAKKMGCASSKKVYEKHKLEIKRKKFLDLLSSYLDEPLPKTKLGIDNAVKAVCLNLYLNAKCTEVPKVWLAYQKYKELI